MALGSSLYVDSFDFVISSFQVQRLDYNIDLYTKFLCTSKPHALLLFLGSLSSVQLLRRVRNHDIHCRKLKPLPFLEGSGRKLASCAQRSAT